MSKQSFVLFLLLFVSLTLGCSSGRKRPKDLPPLYPGILTFTQEGKPLEGANVMLLTEGKWSVGGMTAADGTFKLVTNGYYDGAPEGTYKITVTKIIVQQEPTTGKVLKITDVIENKFKREDTTPLEITVGKTNNDQTFDVGKAMKINVPITE